MASMLNALCRTPEDANSQPRMVRLGVTRRAKSLPACILPPACDRRGHALALTALHSPPRRGRLEWFVRPRLPFGPHITEAGPVMTDL